MGQHIAWIRRSARPVIAGLAALFIASFFNAAQVSAGEAPELAEKVAAGELPPLSARLPEIPLMLPVVDEIGQYGGTLRRAFLGPGDHNNYSGGLRRSGTLCA